MDVDTPHWMLPVDEAILDLFDEHPLRLSGIVLARNTGYQRNYISARCQILKDSGLLFKDENALFVLTPYGRRYLDGEIQPEHVQKIVPQSYTGEVRSAGQNLVTGDDVDLRDRVNFDDVELHEFVWGYESQGARDLARALFADVFDAKVADMFYEQFAEAVIYDLDEEWTLSTAEIRKFEQDNRTDS